MLFNSFAFLLFFPIVCIVYFIIPSLKYRNLFLLAASYYFYMNWQPIYALLLLTSTGITYLASLGIDRFSDKKKKKNCLIASLALNLSILFFYKYYGFAAENVTALFSWLGIQIHVPDFQILLPVGISFYIFQALGYSIDVYRGDTRVEKNFFTYALFVSFFPQLVAGPIERSTNLLRQFYQKHQFDGDVAIEGVKIMLWGYFMKLVLADRCAMYVDMVYNHLNDHEGMSTAIATVLFSFQLYGDFAGYTFTAIGAARIMGFHLMDNFRRPYLFSTSVQDYWKRNHISLTSWFMDYVYYPLTERSNSINWWCFSIFLTFLISGFWHGAAWTFIIWGSIHGVLLVMEMRTNKRKKKWEKKYHLSQREWYVWLQRIGIFLVLCLTLVFFRANSLSDAFKALQLIFTPSDFNMQRGLTFILYSFLAFILLFIKEYLEEYKIVFSWQKKYKEICDDCWMIVLLLCICWMGVFDGGQFIYFQF